MQVGAAGRFQGAPFTLVGRLQYRTLDGTWNEWHALFDAGADGTPKSGWLAEDNGRYVFGFEVPLEEAAPRPESLRPELALVVNRESWRVASVVVARVQGAEGELPEVPNLATAFVVADLRSPRDEVGTLAYADAAAPTWSVGRSVALGELALQGLAERAERTLAGRAIECPNCGAPLEIRLDTTRSIVCRQCRSVIDLSAGTGGDLAHYRQATGTREPQIPLGSIGTLALPIAGKPARPLPWQVVGYVERCEVAGSAGSADDDDDDGEGQSFWREYLLYHRNEGFAFLVDAEDGWSWTAPITGVPRRRGDRVELDGVLYRKLYDYVGQVTYVLGEFYWRVERDQRTDNTDYVGTGSALRKRLNREATVSNAARPAASPGGATLPAEDREVVWSAGETLPAAQIVTAFKLRAETLKALERDALPGAFRHSLLGKIVFWAIVVIVLLMLVRCATRDDCEPMRRSYGPESAQYRSCVANNRSGSGFRTGGGSFGGFSTGGGHK
ncbi:DUF4178 domain-containing protein [Piscinibacter koreensis]|uniref:DUF4178 domain-containing protein n=1 Tax=Piscinibacter koreensis TaxID=2742824 RepID=UPI003CC91EE5